MTIIQWCNQNAGFINMILAVPGVIALFIAIYAARLPYKKKLLLSSGLLESRKWERGFYISVTNIGNRPVQLVQVAFQYGKHELFHAKYFETKKYIGKILHASEEVRVHYKNFEIKNFQEELRKNNVTGNIYIYAKDTEGMEYRKFFRTCKEMLNDKG